MFSSTLALVAQWIHNTLLKLPQTALHFLHLLSCPINWIFGLSTSHLFQHQPLLTDDFMSALNVLKIANETTQPIAYLQSVEGVLTDAMMYAPVVNISREKWTDITRHMNTILVLLRDYRNELERDARLVDRYYFYPHHYHKGSSNIPHYFVPVLRELCLNINYALLTLQKCHKARKLDLVFSRKRELLRDIEQCRHVLKDSVGKLNAGLLPKVIYQISLDVLSQKHIPFDITATSTPQRYRLIDCAQVTEKNVLCIHEFLHLPYAPYAAVSYVWRGNDVTDDFDTMELTVEGAEDADPISVDVLHDACMASIARGASYLWLDRLCIMQTNREDKNWQIREMYQLYCSCVVCIVIPGGLQRLVPFSDETMWIHRGWTLQEVVAPRDVIVLFAWKLGNGKGITSFAGENSSGNVEEACSGRSAFASLTHVLDFCLVGRFQFKSSTQTVLVEANLFGRNPIALNGSDGTVDSERVGLPHVVALMSAIDRHSDLEGEREHFIWKSSLMRSSSRPVDMVFSIMGLFGVTLDTSSFGKNDRIRATIALAQAILEQDQRASWLGVSFHVPPCPHISTFPAFPQTSVSGKALMSVPDGVHDVSELMESDYPNEAALGPLPKGRMDDDGYLTFDAKAVSIVPDRIDRQHEINYDDASQPMWIRALDGSTWRVCVVEEDTESSPPGSEWHEQAYAVLLGFYNGWPARTTGDNVRAMLVVTHAPEKFHVVSYFMLSCKSMRWASEWKQHSLCVGGPNYSD